MYFVLTFEIKEQSVDHLELSILIRCRTPDFVLRFSVFATLIISQSLIVSNIYLEILPLPFHRNCFSTTILSRV